MLEYVVAQAPNTVELQLLVEQLVERGWQLQGGVAVSFTEASSLGPIKLMFYQALTKAD